MMLHEQGDSTICGTREFIAPEIWEYKRQGSGGNGDGPYKAASDVYSLGMTFFEILTHKRPFMGLAQGGDTTDFLFER
jgi:serine/threonine protein kinase